MQDISHLKIPKHIAIIMDGNGRWAQKRGLPRIIGHKTGVESVREVVRVASELGVEYLTLYTFSRENWKRPKDEVMGLMNLLKRLLRIEVEELNRNNVRIKAIGRLQDLPDEVLEELERARRLTEKNDGLKLYLALSYGGRAEIVDALKKALKKWEEGKLSPDVIDEESFHQFLYDPELPDPDLLIRTSGEMRVSNFMLWQIAYSEIYVTPTLWPDFRREELLKAIEDYSKRERRFGGIG
ncbi:MAG: isoprenyl transferase [Candidatus Hydrothermae bacterium]|nr:isoprenyl transferase [Candidatus Hydrothermae bacterium]